MENVTEKITNVIAEYLDKDPSEIVATNTFTQNGLDSLDIMELVMQIEEELDCKIELSQEINTIEKLAQYVEAHKGE
ncbi:MAG: acyl carrier protein [Lachnospiraceae bacterium]|jgi:acyl carrier protein|nr:acyl carrier protein [Lachnospiraceae bacterium]HAP33187.1 acyl carrier protein [Lachnospiraceae bacterium]HBZ89895.1 acyl carrier protein [Lachnospiraceae bacterium]